jgi:hypothetical protein
LEQVYQWLITKFEPDRLGRSLYKVGEFIEYLEKETNESEIDMLRRAYTKYKRNIKLIDLDIMLGHYFTILMNNKEQKLFVNKSLTSPVCAIPEFFKSQKIYYQGKKVKSYKILGCNNCKAKAIKIILEKLGYLKCVDSYYCPYKHVAMRWILTGKFPRYRELEEYLSKDLIDSFNDKVKTSHKSA